jgi:hypothetical protein
MIAFEARYAFAGFDTNLAANVGVRPPPKPTAFLAAIRPCGSERR